MAGSAVLPQYERREVFTGVVAVRLWPVDPTGQTTAALPLDTVPLNGAWPVGWTHVGASEEGATVKFSRSTEKLTIEEQQTAIIIRTTASTLSVDMVLAQDSLKSMKIAFGGGRIETTAPTTSAPGVSRLIISPEVDDFAVGIEGINEFGKPRRILIPIANSIADTENAYRRSAAYHKWPISLESLVDIENCEFRDIVADALTP